MTDDVVQLEKERFACDLLMLTGMDVLHGRESVVDYAQLGTTDPAGFDDGRRLAGTVRDKNSVIALRSGRFDVDLPHYLKRMARGFAGQPHW